MDGFTAFKTAAAEALHDAVEVMDPFHVVQLAGDTQDRCRQPVQHATQGHRGRAGDPLYGVGRALHTGEALLTRGGVRPERSCLLERGGFRSLLLA